jgi:hypothetical protein
MKQRKIGRREVIGSAAAAAGLLTATGRALALQATDTNREDGTMSTLQEDIQAVFDSYVAHWNNYEADAMAAFWDRDEPDPIYVAEEIDPLRGWDALEAYWRGAVPNTTEHLITIRDLTVREIAPGVAHAFWQMGWNVYFSTERLYAKPIGGEVRATALLREKPDGWKFFHWIEAPLASLIQLKRAHEEAVDPRLLDKLKAKGIEF